ncbi:MAG TPA: glycosyltransferase [Saprospiraceae bacterium]|nr:glycosyltransferase [Saprospiraceae bacterium]
MFASFGLSLLIFFLVLQGKYWLFAFNHLKLAPKSPGHQPAEPVSVIVCARNARVELERNLESLLTQSYPVYEIILVDDDSSDGTETWASQILTQYKHLRYYRHQKTRPGKKDALAFGVSKARYDWLALTDADCRATSSHWLSRMMARTGGSVRIVLGYAPFFKEPGALNAFIRFEGLLTAIQYLSAAAGKFPYMGTGRNLLYHKSIFDAKAMNEQLPYGDDDLLVGAKATPGNTAVCLDAEAFMYSAAASDYRDYFRQKRRHYAASLHYSFGMQLLLALYMISMLGFSIGLILLLITGWWAYALGLLVVQLALTWPFFCKLSGRLLQKDLCFLFPLLLVIYQIHLVLQAPYLAIRKKGW